MARKAKSTQKLLDQVNLTYPNRSKISDGWIGDPAHASRKSDHNPNSRGVVCAIDLTHDPAHGFDSYAFAETLRLNRDPRIKNVISNSRIFSSTVQPWVWRKYGGPNAHAHHVHVSVGREGMDLDAEEKIYDDDGPWEITVTTTAEKAAQKAPLPPVTIRVAPNLEQEMAGLIVKWEARRDGSGHITRYDTAGGAEIAGITRKDHRDKYDEIEDALEDGNHAQVEKLARAYVLEYTKPVAGWVSDAGLQFFLRDCYFNRGPTGAVKILQIGLGYSGSDVDGNLGSGTRDRLVAATKTPEGIDSLIQRLRGAREHYEDMAYPARRSSNQWQGLVNRWNNALAAAKDFRARNQVVAPNTKGAVVTTTVVVGGGAAVVAKKKFEFHPSLMLVIFLVFCIAALLTWHFWPRRK